MFGPGPPGKKGRLLGPGSCFLFSAKSTRILEQLSRSPDRRTARSTESELSYSTWQNRVPLRLLLSSRTSLMSPHLSKRT